jgi:hypothetical protein
MMRIPWLLDRGRTSSVSSDRGVDHARETIQISGVSRGGRSIYDLGCLAAAILCGKYRRIVTTILELIT